MAFRVDTETIPRYTIENGLLKLYIFPNIASVIYLGQEFICYI